MLRLNILRKTPQTQQVKDYPIDQSWNVKRIAEEAPPESWEKVFEDAKYELEDVSKILDEQERIYGSYYPLKKDIFAAFQRTKLSDVKVVILGQDPYPQTISVNGKSVARAVGFSFSVRKEDSIPSSLRNIYIELANSVRGFTTPDHGCLEEWTNQGVLMLNSCLTIRPGSPGSHGDIWLGFINKVFRAIAEVNPYCIFLLWGREAQKIKPMLGERSIVLEAAHPSGLSARRGFFGCNHFNQVNHYLILQGKVGINWKISPLANLLHPDTQSTHTETHQRKLNLAPVDPNLLITAVSNKPTTAPQVNPSPKIPYVEQRKPVIPIILDIPNVKPKTPNIEKETPIVETKKSPTNKSIIPTIPKINFASAVNQKNMVSFNMSQKQKQETRTDKPIIINNITQDRSELPVIDAILH